MLLVREGLFCLYILGVGQHKVLARVAEVSEGLFCLYILGVGQHKVLASVVPDGLTDDTLLVRLVVGLAVLLHVLGVEEGELAEGALAVAGLGLVAQEVVVVGLRLAPALRHELDVEHPQAVQTQHAVRAVVFLHRDGTDIGSELIQNAIPTVTYHSQEL